MVDGVISFFFLFYFSFFIQNFQNNFFRVIMQLLTRNDMHNPCTKIEKTETTEITKISNSFSIFPRIAREPRVNKTLRLCPRPARRLFISQFRIRCKGKKNFAIVV